MFEWGIVGMESQRNKCLEPARLVLQRAQLQQMIHAILVVFHVTIKHRRIGFQANPVGHSGRVQPLIAIDFVVANDVTNAIGKNFRASAGERIHSGSPKSLQRFLNRQLGTLRQVGDLDHGKSFQVHLRKTLLQTGNEVEEVLQGQVRMKASHYMKLSNGFCVSRGSRLKRLFQSHRVCARRVLFPPERAQPACGDANICGIDVPVDVEVGLISVQSLAHVICQPAHRKDVTGLIQHQAVFGAQASPRENLIVNRG